MCVFVSVCACFPCLLSSWPPLLSLHLISIWIAPPQVGQSRGTEKKREGEGGENRKTESSVRESMIRFLERLFSPAECLPNRTRFVRGLNTWGFSLCWRYKSSLEHLAKDSWTEKHICTRIYSFVALTCPHNFVWTGSPRAHPACCMDSVVLRHHRSLTQPCVGPPAAGRALALHPVYAGVCLSDHPICCPLPSTAERLSTFNTQKQQNNKVSSVFLAITVKCEHKCSDEKEIFKIARLSSLSLKS